MTEKALSPEELAAQAPPLTAEQVEAGARILASAEPIDDDSAGAA